MQIPPGLRADGAAFAAVPGAICNGGEAVSRALLLSFADQLDDVIRDLKKQAGYVEIDVSMGERTMAERDAHRAKIQEAMRAPSAEVEYLSVVNDQVKSVRHYPALDPLCRLRKRLSSYIDATP